MDTNTGNVYLLSELQNSKKTSRRHQELVDILMQGYASVHRATESAKQLKTPDTKAPSHG